MNKQFSTIVILAGIILCAIGGYFGYNYAKNSLSTDLSNLNQRIEEVFHGKDVIQDGQAEILVGKNTNYGYNLASGGFTIHRLSKESGGFVKSKISAGNIIWLKEKLEYDQSYWGNYRSTNRPEPKEAYNDAYDYLLTGTEKEPNFAYTRETFTEIKDFPLSLAAEYHIVSQVEHPTELYWNDHRGWQFDYDTYKLTYNVRKEFYTILLNEEKAKMLITKFTILGLGLGIFITFIIGLLMRFFIPNAGKGESIFVKKWRNIDTNSIITIEPKLFGKHSVVLIEDDKIKRGFAKITDNGESIHLSFADSEIFYRIKNISHNKLEMENLASNKLTKFELLGSNAFKVEENASSEEIVKNISSEGESLQ